VAKTETTLRLGYRLHRPSPNYDQNAQPPIKEHILTSQIVDTAGKAVDSTFQSKDLEIQPNYAIGVFKNRQLVLTPLKRFQQVRPSFAHVDEEKAANTVKTKEQ
jgi:hypothetical protein